MLGLHLVFSDTIHVVSNLYGARHIELVTLNTIPSVVKARGGGGTLHYTLCEHALKGYLM